MSLTIARLLHTVVSLCILIGPVFNSLSAQTSEPALTTPSTANQSILTLTAQLQSNELTAWLSEVTPKIFVGEGNQTVCQVLLGIEICGTAKWQYNINRIADIQIIEDGQNPSSLTLETPLIVDGIVGIEGDVARALGLHSVPISAELKLKVQANLLGNSQGCPQVTTKLTPDWVDKPTAVLPGNIKIRLTEALEGALAEQMQQVQQQLNRLLDCDLILAQLEPAWSKCYIDASRKEIGPALWELHPRKIHWSVKTSGQTDGENGRTAQPNKTLALVLGLNTDVNLQLGLQAMDVESQLKNSSCTYQLAQFQQPVVSDGVAHNPSQAKQTRLIFDPTMTSSSTQKLRVNATHESLAAFVESNYAGRNLGQDNEGNEVLLRTITLLPGGADLSSNSNSDTGADSNSSLTLEAQFDALVQASDGFVGWVQDKLGLADKNLSGVMRLVATPVWNTDSRSLHFDHLNATVTQLEPGSKLSLSNAVFSVIQSHVQKALAEQSSVQLGNAIDRLSNNINESIDARAQEALTEFGGVWSGNTASIQVDNIVSAGQGMILDAQLNADWVVRFDSTTWPRDLGLGNTFTLQRR